MSCAAVKKLFIKWQCSSKQKENKLSILLGSMLTLYGIYHVETTKIVNTWLDIPM